MENTWCTIYLVRHGETFWNVAHKIQGHTDIDLTKNGEEQAKTLGEMFSNIHFDGVFSSDLLRAKRTAEIIKKERKLAVITSVLLRERKFGPLEGKYLKDLDEFNKTLHGLTDAEIVGYKSHQDIESYEEILTRFLQLLREVAIGNPGKTVLMVTHGGVMQAFLAHIGFYRFQDLPRHIGNTAYIKIATDGLEFTIKETSGIPIDEKKL